MQALPLIGLSSLRIEGALKANPNPEALSGQLPPGRLEISSGRRADVEQCLGRSLIQTLPKSLESLPLSGGPQSVQRERTRQCWSRAAKGPWQSWGGSGEGRRGHPDPPLPPCPGRASRATWNAALQSFPLNSLKLLDGKRQYSCFHYYFLSPFARWFLFWGEAFKQRSGWIFKGISGKDLWASRW